MVLTINAYCPICNYILMNYLNLTVLDITTYCFSFIKVEMENKYAYDMWDVAKCAPFSLIQKLKKITN